MTRQHMIRKIVDEEISRLHDLMHGNYNDMFEYVEDLLEVEKLTDEELVSRYRSILEENQ